jgi:hypothetical protein
MYMGNVWSIFLIGLNPASSNCSKRKNNDTKKYFQNMTCVKIHRKAAS